MFNVHKKTTNEYVAQVPYINRITQSQKSVISNASNYLESKKSSIDMKGGEITLIFDPSEHTAKAKVLHMFKHGKEN